MVIDWNIHWVTASPVKILLHTRSPALSPSPPFSLSPCLSLVCRILVFYHSASLCHPPSLSYLGVIKRLRLGAKRLLFGRDI